MAEPVLASIGQALLRVMAASVIHRVAGWRWAMFRKPYGRPPPARHLDACHYIIDRQTDRSSGKRVGRR
jgi:hypothetical protein